MPTFDPDAVVAVLNAGYLPTSPANLARAWRERPELFGGGVISGTHGDKLTLPDGTVWDLIFNVDDPIARHYQAIIPGGGGGAAEDPYALEPGPMEFIETDFFAPPARDGTYEGIVARAIAELDAGDGAIDLPRGAIVDELGAGGGFDDATAGALAGARDEIDGQASNLADVDITGVAGVTDGLAGDASAKRDELPEDNEYTAPFIVPPDPGPPPPEPTMPGPPAPEPV